MASLFILATLSLSLLCICQADKIFDLCSLTPNPSLCSQTIRSDPRSYGADLRSWGKIIIEKSKIATRNVITIAKLAGGEIANSCVETGGDAIDKLNECVGYLKKLGRASARELYSIGSLAFENVASCDHLLGSREPAELKAASQKAQDLIDVLLVIANFLN
ncbi:pectinesterase inhibitor [Phtheirospermum japonicum]|uniref:Pectinesterase inhibitor n=1 Tax=Phtheirospermum japonicum TaxID=374723 RepID=A0A830BWF4_9LAMI|nr:pectinesterase inhibitor [Phtheirospermum japonicum]